MPQPTFTITGVVRKLEESKQTSRGTIYKVLLASEGKNSVDYFPVTGWNETGGTLARSIGKIVLIQARLTSREWQGKYYLDITADGVFQTAEAPSVEAEYEQQQMPEFPAVKVDDTPPTRPAKAQVVYGQPPEEQDDIPF